MEEINSIRSVCNFCELVLDTFEDVSSVETSDLSHFFVVTYVIKLPGQVSVKVSCFPVIFVYICHRCQVDTMMSSRFCHLWRVPTT